MVVVTNSFVSSVVPALAKRVVSRLVLGDSSVVGALVVVTSLCFVKVVMRIVEGCVVRHVKARARGGLVMGTSKRVVGLSLG